MDENELRAITGAWDHATLPKNVRVGSRCLLERKDSFALFRSTRDPGLVLGDRVRVYTWTTFNVEPSGAIEVGDDSVIVGAVFMCAGDIRIGRRVIVSYGVTIADSDFHPHDPELRRRDAIANAPFGDRSHRPQIVSRSVTIEDDAWIGIGAIVLKGVRVGRAARIGAGAIVVSDVPDGGCVAGNPARAVPPGQNTP